MIKQIFLSLLTLSAMQSCSDPKTCADPNCTDAKTVKSSIDQNAITAKNTNEEISCTLTSAELRKRKETVIASLKSRVLERKELPNGYSFRFEGTDAVIDELAEFVKSERTCCKFFVFNLSFSGDGKEAWLSLTGPEGTKEMISEEIGL